jgi:hypothetical protein
MMRRLAFTVSTDTGTQGDTGPALNGTIRQCRWSPTTADTGADLYLALLTQMGDTAGGMAIVNDPDCLGTGFTRQSAMNQVSVDGLDTGHSLSDAPFVAAGERPRLKVTPGGAAVAGKLYLYIED